MHGREQSIRDSMAEPEPVDSVGVNSCGEGWSTEGSGKVGAEIIALGATAAEENSSTKSRRGGWFPDSLCGTDVSRVEILAALIGVELSANNK